MPALQFSQNRDSPPPVSPAKSRTSLYCLLLLFFVVQLALIQKPFHTDEPLCVWIAQQIVHHPFDFYGFELNWEGHREPVSQFYQNPPLMSYFLAIASIAVGWNEAGLRLAVIPVNLLTVLGMWQLSRLFCRRPALAVAMVLCMPVFLLSVTALMCEPLSICFWIWTVYFWIRGSQDNDRWLWIAGFLAAGAILSKYSSLCLLPLLIAHGFIYPATARKTKLLQACALLIPALVTLTYEAFAAHRYHTGALSGAAHYVSTSQGLLHTPALVRVMNTAAFVGGGLAAASLVSLLRFNRWFLIGLALASTSLAALAAHLLLPPPGWNQSFASSLPFFAQYAFLFAGGVVVAVLCGQALLEALRRRQWRDELFLCLWIGGVFVFTAEFNWSINARSILPMAFPASVLVVRELDRMRPFPRMASRALIATAGLLSGAVAFADYRLASTIRSAAIELVHIRAFAGQPGLSGLSPPGRLFFAGHWGFQYYMQAGGATELDDATPQIKVGEIAIFPLNSYGAAPGGQNFKVLGSDQVGGSSPLTTVQTRMGANFYCSYGYDLPFIFGPIPPETFIVLQVTPLTRIHR